MAEQTGISWADATFNPWVGCTKVGPGCDNCYAERDMAIRRHFVEWGPGAPRRRTVPSNWAKPIAWDRKAEASGRPMRVFCASLADVFDNEVDFEWRADLFRLIRRTRALTWMLLTKRIGNVTRMLPEDWDDGAYGNVWLGATVVNQEEADRDIPKLLEIPARVRWLSCEPLLGPIDLSAPLHISPSIATPPHVPEIAVTGWTPFRGGYGRPDPGPSGLHWVIVGGESGPAARVFEIDWARRMRDQCRAAGVPFFMKQVGAAPADETLETDIQVIHRAGADPAEWPADLRVREFPA